MEVIGILIFLFGLCIGSFLNVLIYRLPEELPITGRSFCPKCKNKIIWCDNVPLLSYLLLGGKCRFCHSPISIQYPLVELVTGILFLLISFSYLGRLEVLEILGILVIVSILVAIFVIDLKFEIIPDVLIAASIPIALLFALRSGALASSLLSAIGASLFFLFLHLLTRGKGMGFGDVKLVFLMGLLLGFPKVILSLYLAFLTGALAGVILILVGRKRFGQHLPFGPFLTFSTLVALLKGGEIISWLMGKLF